MIVTIDKDCIVYIKYFNNCSTINITNKIKKDITNISCLSDNTKCTLLLNKEKYVLNNYISCKIVHNKSCNKTLTFITI